MAQIGTRKLTISIDGTEVAPEVSTVEIRSEETDSDFVSFQQASQGGGRTYKLGITMAQDAASGSLWDQVWSHSGETVDVVVRPHGNSAPSESEPHFEGSVVISEPDGVLIGGEADPSPSSRFTTECEFEFTAKPLRVTS